MMDLSDDPVQQLGLRIAHVGINASDAEEAACIASTFESLMGLKRRELAPSYFAGSLVEVMKHDGRGEKGHIGFHVDNMPAAERYFCSRGLEIDESSRVLNDDGSTYLVYFKQQIAGFAIHLTVAD